MKKSKSKEPDVSEHSFTNIAHVTQHFFCRSVVRSHATPLHTQKSVPQHFLIYKGVSIDIAERSVENILKVLVNTVTNQRSVSIDIALKRWPTLFLLCVEALLTPM